MTNEVFDTLIDPNSSSIEIRQNPRDINPRKKILFLEYICGIIFLILLIIGISCIFAYITIKFPSLDQHQHQHEENIFTTSFISILPMKS